MKKDEIFAGGEKKISYSEILKKSLMITWENKFLWFFGFLILLGSCTSAINGKDNFFKSSAIENFMKDYLVLSIFIFTFIFFLSLVLIALKFLATAAIIKSVNNIKVYKQSPVKTIFNESKRYIVRLFLLQFFVTLGLLIIVAAMFAPAAYLFSIKNILLGFVFSLVALIVVISLVIMAYFILRYAQIFLVLADLKIKESIEMAYDLLEKNIKRSLMMGIIVIGIEMSSLFVLMLLFFVTILVLSPFMLVAYLLFAKAVAPMFFIIALFLAVEAAVFFSWSVSFIETIWLLFFQEISLNIKKEQESVETEKLSGEIPTPEAV